MTTGQPHPFQMSPTERREEAFQLVEEIKVAISAGKSFSNPHVSAFFVDMRNLLKFGPNARITPGQLGGLRKVAARMKGKRKDGTVRGRQSGRPTGIIRTLPSLYGQRAAFAASINSREESIGARRYRASMKLLERGKLDCIYIALQALPKHDILHIYLIIDGVVDVRLNIAGYERGDARKCWDETIPKPKYWAVCTPPVSRPPEQLLRRGFQGFRYTEELW